ncbi:MAG: PrgI family protein [Candidatus Zambryskibacteria bacterium]|nr:PrgI family protein [Candidatus Zambryskibacteria bacterium]
MRFQVPQFIEIEDKIFGPLTFKQFIYLAGGAGICVVLFTFLPKFLAILVSLPVAGLALALTFYKVNDKPFINVMEAFFNYTLGNKLYIWKKEEKKVVGSKEYGVRETQIQQIQVPRLSESKLRKLTWSLDIKENQNPITENSNDEL